MEYKWYRHSHTTRKCNRCDRYTLTFLIVPMCKKNVVRRLQGKKVLLKSFQCLTCGYIWDTSEVIHLGDLELEPYDTRAFLKRVKTGV